MFTFTVTQSGTVSVNAFQLGLPFDGRRGAGDRHAKRHDRMHADQLHAECHCGDDTFESHLVQNPGTFCLKIFDTGNLRPGPPPAGRPTRPPSPCGSASTRPPGRCREATRAAAAGTRPGRRRGPETQPLTAPGPPSLPRRASPRAGRRASRSSPPRGRRAGAGARRRCRAHRGGRRPSAPRRRRRRGRAARCAPPARGSGCGPWARLAAVGSSLSATPMTVASGVAAVRGRLASCTRVNSPLDA